MIASKTTIRKALYAAVKATPPVGPNCKQDPTEWEEQQKRIIETLRDKLDEQETAQKLSRHDR